MPGDWDITDDEGDTYARVLECFQANPDPRCVPLFVNSVSKTTGLGMYEHIRFVLMRHRREDVVPHLRHGLISGNDGVKSRCCWWAVDVDAWELEDVIRPLADAADEDIRDSARSFLELREEMTARMIDTQS